MRRLARPAGRNGEQLDLFTQVLLAYASVDGPLSNEQMYDSVRASAGLAEEAMSARQYLGRTAENGSPMKRKLRWFQQTLKHMGAIEKVSGDRGRWRMTQAMKQQLTPAAPHVAVVAFSTELGCALWAACEHGFGRLDEPISLMLSSPPYPLRKPRAYGNPDASSYVDFICRGIEGVVKHLKPGGIVTLNVSNDIFDPGVPARSLYLERLVLGLHDRLGLHLVDRLVWVNPSKAPAPVQWSSKRRLMLRTGHEPVYVFSNAPTRMEADNRRVLQAHTQKHLDLIASGGERRGASFSDGAYRVRPGAYSSPTAGRIPTNVLHFAHTCGDRRRTAKAAREAGLPTHGAGMPLRLAKFLVEWLSKPGDLVVDPYAGWMTTGLAAELTGRRWLCTELMGEYVAGAAERFKAFPGFGAQGLFDPR